MGMPEQQKQELGKFKQVKLKWDRLTSGWFGNVVYIVLGFVIALATITVLKPVLGTDTPVVAVFSESMVPNLQKGDLVIVQGAPAYPVGDIVVYDAPRYRYPIIHRVINVTDEGIITKGDANPSPDPWVTPESGVHGRAAVRIPLLGWVKVLAYELFGLV